MDSNQFKQKMTAANSCLILEDNPARYTYLVNLALEICYPCIKRLVIVTTAEMAIKELSSCNSWGLIMLDHDLDGQIYVASENFNTGYQVAKYIKDYKVKYNTIIVHTLNEYAVPKMLKVLEETGGKVVYKPCVDL